MRRGVQGKLRHQLGLQDTPTPNSWRETAFLLYYSMSQGLGSGSAKGAYVLHHPRTWLGWLWQCRHG